MVLPSRPVHYLAPMVAFAAIILLLFHLLVFPTPTSPFPTTTSNSTTKTLTLIPKAKHPFTDLISAYSQPDRMPTLQGRQQVEAQLLLFFDPRTRGGSDCAGVGGGARQRAGQGWTWIPTTSTTSTPAAAGSPASTTSTPAAAGSPASVPSPVLADRPNELLF
ncbi:40S ribosomal protein S12-like [Iris pallida]|uniref:40S ribosomal protein S12-like n=1 Tax=Iris pallida TaxID=29817 RepID=A0AAX6GBQ5_IRIPA|nr:40S ribosomal protein S12-like [Iris pallida]